MKPVNIENGVKNHKTNINLREKEGERKDKRSSSSSRYTALFVLV